MQSLADCYNYLLDHQEKWNYYYRLNNIETDNLLDDAETLIADYLSTGGKFNYKIREILESVNKNDPARITHTMSVFLLGICMYDKCEDIRKILDKFVNVRLNHNQNVRLEFNYYWFMTCFFHDLGYAFEELEKHEAIDRLIEISDGKISILLPSTARGIPEAIRCSYSNYFKYRYIECNTVDHGIIGGKIFFNVMNKLYYEHRNSRTRGRHSHSNLFWSKELLYKVQLPIAWTIATHNIWVCNEGSDNSNIYNRYNLDRLIVQNPIIDLDSHPLLAILSIIDTIDPIKHFKQKDSCLTAEYISANVLLSFQNRGVEISLTDKLIMYKYEYYTMIKKLEQWVCCIVDETESGVIIEL